MCNFYRNNLFNTVKGLCKYANITIMLYINVLIIFRFAGHAEAQHNFTQ